MTIYEGELVSEQVRVRVVVTHFNEFITPKLLGGAPDGLKRSNVREEEIDVTWVPGAFEIPLAAARMTANRKCDAVICPDAVIRGSASHYDYICSKVSKGVAQASLSNGLPVMFGVLATDTVEQAIKQAGTKAGNEGYECALDVTEIVSLFREMKV